MSSLEPEFNENTSDTAGSDFPVDSKLLKCCSDTIDMHGKNNPMMVCSECKQIIKCFDEEKAYRNYQRFCSSRHRKILATVYSKWWVVVFKSYDTFTT